MIVHNFQPKLNKIVYSYIFWVSENVSGAFDSIIEVYKKTDSLGSLAI